MVVANVIAVVGAVELNVEKVVLIVVAALVVSVRVVVIVSSSTRRVVAVGESLVSVKLLCAEDMRVDESVVSVTNVDDVVADCK